MGALEGCCQRAKPAKTNEGKNK